MATATIPEVTLGVRLYMARKKAGLEQEEVAKAIGVSRGTISNWERDKGEPRLSHLRRLAEITSTPVEWLSDLTASLFDSEQLALDLFAVSSSFASAA